MLSDMQHKIQCEIDKEITTEVQVVYVLVQVRKIIERQKLKQHFLKLNFHCDWVAHASMDRTAAINTVKVVRREYGNIFHLGAENLENRCKEIFRLDNLKNELSRFLTSQGLSDFTADDLAWRKFLVSYMRVIEEIPLQIFGAERSAEELRLTVEVVKNTVTGIHEHIARWIYKGPQGCGAFEFSFESP